MKPARDIPGRDVPPLYQGIAAAAVRSRAAAEAPAGPDLFHPAAGGQT